MDARMPFEPGACLQTEMTTEIVGNDEDIPSRIVSFDVGEQGNVAAFCCVRQHIGSVPCHRAPAVPHRPRFSPGRVRSRVAL